MAKSVVVTGANRGIGLELAKKFKNEGFTVIGVCRHDSSELEKVADQVVSAVDVTNESALQSLAAAIKVDQIDILINNAGLLVKDELNSFSSEDLIQQFRVNAVGPLCVTQALLPLLKKGSKIAMITSRMGSVEDNTSGGYYGYRMSKSALNMAGKTLAEDLKPKGIAVALLHPGYVKTDMTGHTGDITPEDAASGIYERIDELDLDTSGGFWHSNGERLPW